MTGPRLPQWFHFGPWVFSIDAAQALIATVPRDPQPLDVATWAVAYSLTRADEPHPRVVSLIGPASSALDRAHAMSTDPTQPLIVGQISINRHPPAPLLIDGTHRLYRAWREGKPQLPAYVLTAEETRRIQDSLILGPGRASGTSPSP